MGSVCSSFWSLITCYFCSFYDVNTTSWLQNSMSDLKRLYEGLLKPIPLRLLGIQIKNNIVRTDFSDPIRNVTNVLAITES